MSGIGEPRGRQEDQLENDPPEDELDDGLDPNEDGADAGDDESDVETGDDSAEDDAGTDEGQEGRPAPVRGRGERDYGRLRQERREAVDRVRNLERELAEARASRGHTPPDQSAARERQDRRDRELEAARLRGPEDFTDTRLRHQQEDFDARLGQLQIATLDASDRSAFQTLCARNSVIDGLSDAVEQRLSDLRRQGGNAPRETIAKFLLGERAMQRAARAKGKQGKRGAQEIERERTKVRRGGGSDLQRGTQRGGDEKSKREDRLKDLQI